MAVAELGWLFEATFGRFWNRVVVFWNGKHVAVLGARGVGKSHLIKFLTTGSIPAVYKQTVAPEKTESKRLQLKELDLKIKSMLDMGGAVEARAQWQKQVEQADIVFYLFRADQVLSGNVEAGERIVSDGRHLGEWLKSREPRPKLCVIGTHCDHDPSFRGQVDSHHGDYVSRIRKLPSIHRMLMLCGGMSQLSLVVGSMKTTEATENLLLDVFRHVEVEA